MLYSFYLLLGVFKILGMKKLKRYVFEFALFMVMWMGFNALMSVAYEEDFQGWMQLFFAFCLLVITDVIGEKIFITP